jgi:hypothetical protein
MELSEKAKIYYNVWCCAYQRRHMYRGTLREYGEHATILMCLKMKDGGSLIQKNHIIYDESNRTQHYRMATE